MFSIIDEATIKTAAAIREDEVQRLLSEREARQERPTIQPARWRWRVEPGKEEAFEHLRGWLLRGKQDAVVEAVTQRRQASVRMPDRAHKPSAECARARCRPTGRRLSLVPSSVRSAGRSLSIVSRRLLQWGAGPQAGRGVGP